MVKRLKVFVFVFFLCSFELVAENLRLTSLTILNVNNELTSTQVRYGAGVAFKVNGPQYFLQGLEIEIRQTNTTLYFPNSLEYQIFSCTEALNPDMVNVSASPIEKRLLPNRLITTLQMPTRVQNTLKTSTYAKTLSKVLSPENEYVLIRIMPVLKGLSTEFEQSLFTISAKPIFTNEGGLQIETQFPKEITKVYTSLDGEQVSFPTELDFLILPVGEHKLVLEADQYRTEVRTIQIQQAEILKLDILFRSIIPVLHVMVPKEVEVFFDRKKITPDITPMEISVGKHTVRLQLGSYEVIRQIDAEEGKTYTITMDIGVDLAIED